jgi:hypothetical protein
MDTTSFPLGRTDPSDQVSTAPGAFHDELDVEHLVRGLSRCDIATADRSMAYIMRERTLIPQRCQLVSGREGPDGIIGALDAWSAEPSKD